MNRTLQTLYGLKWNPFSPELPTEACRSTPRLELFGSRIEGLAQEGGFALLTGDVGTGKSVALRLLVRRLGALRDVTVGVFTRPQSAVPDFYRELGELFGLRLSPHNRWAGAKLLRERWRAHIEQALFRAVLIIDEAQEMRPAVLQELRLLASAELDSRALLTVVLAGDLRLAESFRSPELLSVGSRLRVRLALESLSPAELADVLRHVLAEAGNPGLMTPELIAVLAEHALGNLRVLMNFAGELLDTALQRKVTRLDEKLYLEVFAQPLGVAGGREAPRSRAKTR